MFVHSELTSKERRATRRVLILLCAINFPRTLFFIYNRTWIIKSDLAVIFYRANVKTKMASIPLYFN